MQILLGTKETIIKINSKSIKIDYIQQFINTNFSYRTIEKNSIYIPSSKKDYYHRIFLLKWLYTLYSKKTNIKLPQLKESLIKRQNKPIRIILQEEIIYNIIWKVLDKNKIKIQIKPFNNKIAAEIKRLFSGDILSNNIYLYLDTKEKKEKLEIFLTKKNNFSDKYIHVYDIKELDQYLKKDTIKKSIINDITKAHLLLGSSPNDDIKTLKKLYKKLAMKYHPDKAHSRDDETLFSYTKKFQNILNAYEVLLQKAS